MRIGICTIAFSTLPLAEALSTAAAAGAAAVEIWGKDHFPESATPSDIATIRRTAEAYGIRMPAVGSYANAGDDAWTASRFDALLGRTADLGADTIRVWAGKIGSAQATPRDWEIVTDTLRRWGELAANRGVRIVVERHCGTLTDYEQARRLIENVASPAVRLNYQVPFPWSPDAWSGQRMLDDLIDLIPLSAHMHVQNYRRRNAETDTEFT